MIVQDCGVIEYGAAWDMQRAVFEKVLEGGEDCILICEHPHVYTLGNSGKAANLLIGDEVLARIGATYFKTDRGGDITYHGFGQIVVYPIVNVRRLGIGLRRYIEILEEAIIDTVACWGIKAQRIDGATGVWVMGDLGDGSVSFSKRDSGNVDEDFNTAAHFGVREDLKAKENEASANFSVRGDLSKRGSGNVDEDFNTAAHFGVREDLKAKENEASTHFSVRGDFSKIDRKIAALGVKASHNITMHGLAMNVNTDLKYFNYINPCGFVDKGVTSISKECGREIDFNEVKSVICNRLVELLAKK